MNCKMPIFKNNYGYSTAVKLKSKETANRCIECNKQYKLQI